MNADSDSTGVWLNGLWNRLTEPHSAVTDLIQRRDARLLAAVMLVFAGLYWPTTLLRLIDQPPALPIYGLMMLVSALLVTGLYALSRTAHYRLAIHLLNIYVCVIVVVMFAADTAQALENNALTYFMLTVVLSGLLLSVRATLVVAVTAVGLTALVALAFTPPAFALLMSSTTQMNTIIGGLSVALAATQQHNRRTIARQAHTLAESEASHRALFAALTDAVVVHQQGIITQANEAFGETFGCAPADALGQTVTAFIAPESQALVMRKAQSQLVECYEALGRHNSGRVFPIEISSRPYVHEGQRLRVSAIRDIQARKLAEQELTEERNLLEAVINTIPDQVYVKDRESRFILVNQALLRRYALTRPDEILGKTDFDIFGPEVAQYFYDGEQAMIASGVHVTASYDSRETLPSSEPLWVQVTKVPLRDSAGQVIGILGLNRDITQNREAERQRLELALERQHVELLRGFIAGLSHDLNTPIAALKVGLYLLRRTLHDPAQCEARLDNFEVQVDRLAALVADLLDADRLERSTRVADAAPTALEALLAPVIATGELLATQHGHTLTALIEPGLPPVTVNSDMVRQALNNLVTNAVLYTPGNGVITLEARRAGTSIAIAVRDTGIGIAPADMAHIFDEFYRADKARSSQTGRAGLGLTIAQRIALAHGGDIQVVSEVGMGSTFTLRLPLVPALG